MGYIPKLTSAIRSNGLEQSPESSHKETRAIDIGM